MAIKSIKTIEELRKATENQGGGSREYLQLKPDESVKVRFRQELSLDGKNYDKEKGTALLVPVHRSPINFKKSMVCTLDEGQCYACEQVSVHEAAGKWRPQNHILVNVGVCDEDGKWSNKILDQGFSKSHIGNLLVDYAIENKTIVSTFKMKRTGEKLDTAYSLMLLSTDDKEPDELAAIPVENLDGVKYRTLAYEAQEAYMNDTGDNQVAQLAASASSW